MRVSFAPITEDEARTVLCWRYPIMGLSAEPDADELARDVAALLRPDYHYYAAHDETGRLVGFCCFGEDAQVPGGDYSLPALDIGLGLNPDLTGRGLSHSFLEKILTLGDQLFHPEFYRATVAAINARSLRLFEGSGFLFMQTFLSGEVRNHRFHILLRAAPPAEE
ncbi:MAG: GNAT family N-acetyltransferase [Caldilineaceae bacterium]|jgi:RimJ/RimL family protein N-acetyltransferase|nr:GNAT family N-acetyltransferase [Caldilineaceae bacterium]